MIDLKKPFNILIGVIVIVLICLGLAKLQSLLKTNDRLNQELIGKTEAYKQLTESVAALKIEYKSQADLKKRVAEEFKAQATELQERIKVLSDATYLIREKARESAGSDVDFKGSTTSYLLNEIRFNDGPPVGYVLIFKDGRVVSKIYEHVISAKTAVSRSESSGRYTVLSKADFILKSPSLSGAPWINKPYPLKIVGGTAEVDPTEPVVVSKRFRFWNPKINANVNFDPNGVYPGAGLSLMSYGRTDSDLDFRFVQPGLQYKDRTVYPTIIPVLWRPFAGIISNTYLGPGAAFTGSQFEYFLSLQVGL